ncbi:MAG TPA: cell division protein FtsQ/DivIB [Candidatus Binataceae bacterium]|nr:cell division protein FtsQ/DivIB [Candidatus Binataceae bacterium]
MAAARKKKAESASGWSPRLAGVLLCAFFVLGVMTGFSEAGRRVTLRARNLLHTWADRTLAKLGPFRHAADAFDESIAPVAVALRLRPSERRPAIPELQVDRARTATDPIAIIERHDGFYTLLAGGEMRGPVSPSQQPDLPILSGPGVDNAPASDLLEDAARLVRAEVELSSMVSEMRIEADGAGSFYLDRERMAVTVDLDQEQLQLHRALQVLDQWKGRERLIAMLDMTTPNMAVVRLKTDLPQLQKRAAEFTRARKVSVANHGAEVR